MSGIDYSRWDNLHVESDDDVGTASASGDSAGREADEPRCGSRVRIEQLERSKEYNGREGRITDVLEGGNFAVELDGNPRTVLKVRRKHIVILSGPQDTDPRHDTHMATGASFGNLTVSVETIPAHQPSASISPAPPLQAQLHSPAAGGRDGAPPHMHTPAAPPPPAAASAAAHAAPSPPMDALLLRTFHSPALRAEYGRAFEAGAARRVSEAMAARGIGPVPGVDSERAVREAVTRLAWAAEEEVLRERQRAEHAALHRRFDAGGGGGGGGGAGGLEELDRATFAARRLLWTVDCLQYGEVRAFEACLPRRRNPPPQPTHPNPPRTPPL
jgi:hypothetical protein